MQDQSTWVSPEDSHWNPAGMQRLALLLYGLIRERDLVPALELEPWAEAQEAVSALPEAGRTEASSSSHLKRWVGNRSLDDRLDMSALEPDDAAHFNGGIDLDGLVSPYCSLTIRVSSPGACGSSGGACRAPSWTAPR